MGLMGALRLIYYALSTRRTEAVLHFLNNFLYCYRLLQAKLKQGFGFDPHLLPLRNSLDADAAARAYGASDDRSLGASRNGTDRRTDRCTDSSFLGGVYSSRFTLFLVNRTVDEVGLTL